jgi:hypothetical protein
MDFLELNNGRPEGTGPLMKTDFMNMRQSPPRESLQEKLRSVRGNPAAVDTLIRGLVDLLPKPDEVWPLDERAKWLRLAVGIFDLGYKTDDGEPRQISIAVAKSGNAAP